MLVGFRLLLTPEPDTLLLVVVREQPEATDPSDYNLRWSPIQ